MIRSILAVGLLALLAVPAGPQSQASPPAQPQPRPAQSQAPSGIIVRTYTVIVPVTVKDKSGQLVGDLQKSDFRIFADNVEQKIQNFSSDPVPLSAVVLIDNNLPQNAADQVQKSLTAISAAFGPNDEAALVTYELFPEVVSDFSFNNDLLYTKLRRLDLGSHSNSVNAGPTNAGPMINGQPVPNGLGVPLHGSKRPKNESALNDALYSAAGMLKGRGRDRRKIIFLISDGSNTHNTHPFEDALHSLLAADVSVYAISVTRSLPIGKSLVERGASDIDRYATMTGGDTFFAAKQPQLERLYSDVTEQARNEYTLTFSPEDISKDRDFHDIEVRVRRPNLDVTARQGYYQSAIAVGR
jgi:VWFA-related protein